jgi:hypothetical protein
MTSDVRYDNINIGHSTRTLFLVVFLGKSTPITVCTLNRAPYLGTLTTAKSYVTSSRKNSMVMIASIGTIERFCYSFGTNM